MTPEQQRAILEAAAKACGLIIVGSTKYNLLIASEGCRQGYLWNSIANSADTASMCAKLDIDTIWTDRTVICADDSREREQEVRHDGTPEGKEAAWRLAASMVAAKVGGYTDDI